MNLQELFKNVTPAQYMVGWRSPSNIAFVKYWGKKGHQLPANPSLSMTLKECFTETQVIFTPSDSLKVDCFLDGNKNDKFALKIEKFILNLEELPFLRKVHFVIHTKNTFPHGTGIASSASGLSALALCIADYLLFLRRLDIDFFKLASFLARQASGSACRSVYGGFTTWGDESDYYASVIKVHDNVMNLKDTILVIDDQEKKVPSTAGHNQMRDHFFSASRFTQARSHFDKMVRSLVEGDFNLVGEILESEALSLHAMMLTSPIPYTLLRPNTLLAMEMIWDFRQETKLPLYFTLDAGPNLHLIFPDAYQNKIRTFIEHELAPLGKNLIADERGDGPERC